MAGLVRQWPAWCVSGRRSHNACAADSIVARESIVAWALHGLLDRSTLALRRPFAVVQAEGAWGSARAVGGARRINMIPLIGVDSNVLRLRL